MEAQQVPGGADEHDGGHLSARALGGRGVALARILNGAVEQTGDRLIFRFRTDLSGGLGLERPAAPADDEGVQALEVGGKLQPRRYSPRHQQPVAYLEVATSDVITVSRPHHWYQEFLRFLHQVEKSIPEDLVWDHHQGRHPAWQCLR